MKSRDREVNIQDRDTDSETSRREGYWDMRQTDQIEIVTDNPIKRHSFSL